MYPCPTNNGLFQSDFWPLAVGKELPILEIDIHIIVGRYYDRPTPKQIASNLYIYILCIYIYV